MTGKSSPLGEVKEQDRMVSVVLQVSWAASPSCALVFDSSVNTGTSVGFSSQQVWVELEALDLGFGFSVVVVGGGLGSVLQQTYGLVSLLAVSPFCGQQKLPIPRSLQSRLLVHGNCFSWLKYSSGQQY